MLPTSRVFANEVMKLVESGFELSEVRFAVYCRFVHVVQQLLRKVEGYKDVDHGGDRKMAEIEMIGSASDNRIELTDSSR